MKKLTGLSQQIEQKLNFRLNKNQLREVERLIFEIGRRDSVSWGKILKSLEIPKIKELSNNDKLPAIRNNLIKLRFPKTSKRQKIDLKNIFLPKINRPSSGGWQVSSNFKPLKIIIEKDVKKSYLAEKFKKKFPALEIEEVNYYSEYLKKNKFTVSELKKPLVFIVKEKWDFMKICPCTKHHLRCGYWIFNLGFGCPLDCSYCYLQQYTNFPGIILPANIEDFFYTFDKFHKKLKKPIRIGTGEFSDSLALDDITEYSKKLIPYFRDKNVLFELKTKSVNIANLLEITPSPNIIISWSLNSPQLIKTEEKASASLEERLRAAKKVQKHGYGIGFHFDPIIHTNDWKKLYSQTIKKLYSHASPPFAWISLGTLRSNRELKKICEARFPKSNIFYGELLLGEDKKLRYPDFIKREIYEKILKEIRFFDKSTPIYLCMEDKETWMKAKGVVDCNNIESSLLKAKP